jgi:hypothetical protein
MPGVDRSRKGLPGWFSAKVIQGEPSGGGTHSGSSDEVWKLPHPPMQNGLLDPLHIQEQCSVHAAGGKRPGRA